MSNEELDNVELVQIEYQSAFGPLVLFSLGSDGWLHISIYSTNRRRLGKTLFDLSASWTGVEPKCVADAFETTAKICFDLDDEAAGAQKLVRIQQLWETASEPLSQHQD